MNAGPGTGPPSGRPLPQILATGGLVVAAAVFVWQLPFFFSGGAGKFLSNVAYHAYVVIWMLVVTALGRTLPLRMLASAFFIGVFAVMAVVLVIGFPIAGLVGRDTRLFDSALVPLLEEAVKGAPVLLIFWWLTRRSGWQPSITDGLLLGYIVGAAFDIHEDAMKGRAGGSGFGWSAWTILLPSLNEPFRGIFVAGHAVWTGVLGLAIGAGFFFRQRLRWWVLPVVAFVMVTLDHGRVNYQVGSSSRFEDQIELVSRTLVLNGWLPVYLLLGGTVAAIATEQLVLRRMSQRDRLFRGIRISSSIAWLRSKSLAGLRRFQAGREYARARRAVHYAIWRARDRSLDPQHAKSMGLALIALGQRAGLPFAEPATEQPPPGAPSADAQLSGQPGG